MRKRLGRLLISIAFLSALIVPASPVVFADSPHGTTGPNVVAQNNQSNNGNNQGDTHTNNGNDGNNNGNTGNGGQTNTGQDNQVTAPNNTGTSSGGSNVPPANTGQGPTNNGNTPVVETALATNDNQTNNPGNDNNANNNNGNPSTSGNDPANHQVTLCHATNSNTNPYVVITVDTDAAGGGQDNGLGDHTTHTGPVWNPTLKGQHISWGDIIPPYTDDQGVSFPGMNWTAAGMAIYNNGCKPVGGQGGCTGCTCDNSCNNGCTTNCTTGCTSNCTTEGGRGGEVLGASTTTSSGAVLGASTALPNTGLHDSANWWAILAVVGFMASAVYWRQLIVPLLPRL